MGVHVSSLRCDQARPPAGDLGQGGVMLEEKEEDEGQRHIAFFAQKNEDGSTAS